MKFLEIKQFLTVSYDQKMLYWDFVYHFIIDY